MPPKGKILLPKPSKRIASRPSSPPTNNHQEIGVGLSSGRKVVRRRSSSFNPVVSSSTNPNNGNRKKNQSSSKATNKKPSSKISFNTYTKRVNKSVNPALSVSQESLAILDSYVWDMFYRLVGASQQLVYATGKKTLTERDIEFAVKLVLPGSLKNHAIGFAKKCMILFKNGGEPRNADNSAENVSKVSSSDSELMYHTFRSRIRTTSSPIRRQAPNSNSDDESSMSVDENLVNEENVGEQIEENLQNLPLPQRAPISAFISCIPGFFRRRQL